jgi:glycosyltransferase involved in cell wall biosynthesis
VSERSGGIKPRPLVQIISKPVVSPIHDGTKCFVRDLTNHLESFDTAVFGSAETPADLRRAKVIPIHAGGGRYQPGLGENLRTLTYLLLRSRADLWHFAFAPNRRSSQAARLSLALRRIPTLQTVVSPPRSFDAPERLLFGDIVVTQSRWTRDQFRGAFGFRGLPAPKIEVIHPVAPDVPEPSVDDREKIRRELEVGPEVPLIVYPGDLEMSRGSSRVAELVRAQGDGPLSKAQFVFAYRNKTPAAQVRMESLASSLPASRVRFIADTPLIHALLAEAALVVFPVDDLFGKVDIPIVLLEALRLGTPVFVSDEGPLRELEPAVRIPWEPKLWNERIQAWLKPETPRLGPAQLGQYEPAAAAAAYERLYRALLGVDHPA